MDNILKFPSKAKLDTGITSSVDVIERHLTNYQWHFGRDAYWHYVKKNCKLPDASTAKGLCQLLGHKVKASDKKYYFPKGTMAVSRTSKATKMANLRKLQLLSTIEALVYDLAKTKISVEDVVSELKKNESEHIANHTDVAISWLADFTVSWRSYDKKREKPIAAENPRIRSI
jgi:hypothetical protein